MATETTDTDFKGRHDAREVAQEWAFGTIDLDTNGDGSITVTLSGDLDAAGIGLFATAEAGDGTASVSSVSSGSVDVSISGGTADATGVEFQVVVSEDGCREQTDRTLSGGS